MKEEDLIELEALEVVAILDLEDEAAANFEVEAVEIERLKLIEVMEDGTEVRRVELQSIY